jgi:hypothetical protein
VSVVSCPQDRMLEKIGPTLVCSAITQDQQWQQKLIDAPLCSAKTRIVV